MQELLDQDETKRPNRKHNYKLTLVKDRRINASESRCRTDSLVGRDPWKSCCGRVAVFIANEAYPFITISLLLVLGSMGMVGMWLVVAISNIIFVPSRSFVGGPAIQAPTRTETEMPRRLDSVFVITTS